MLTSHLCVTTIDFFYPKVPSVLKGNQHCIIYIFTNFSHLSQINFSVSDDYFENRKHIHLLFEITLPSNYQLSPLGKEYSCLGDWFVGKNHFFAAANTKESRKDEKYRCFVRNRDDDVYMGHSITPECSVLKTPENSPFRFRMTPGKVLKHGQVCEVSCTFQIAKLCIKRMLIGILQGIKNKS